MKNTNTRAPEGAHKRERRMRRNDFYGRLLQKGVREGVVQAQADARGVSLEVGRVIRLATIGLIEEALEEGHRQGVAYARGELP